MGTVRITVVKKLDMHEIFAGSDPGCSASIPPVCDRFEEGGVFETDMESVPEGFCPFAFIDISRYLSGLRSGVNYPWMKEEGTALVCCTDGFRPVIFRLERIEQADG